MEAMAQSEQLIKSAILTSMDPQARPDQRSAAFKVCEEFKDSSPYLVPCGILLSTKESNPLVRHFGLQLIEHAIKFRWNGMSDMEKINLKTGVMQLASTGTLSILEEETYIKDGIARIIVEMAKRDWPQYWASFVSDLHILSRIGEVQTEIMLYVYLRLVEDAVLFRTIPPKRQRDITMAFIQDMPDIFGNFVSILEHHTTQYKEKKVSTEEALQHQALAHCRVCQTVLQCLTGFIDWMHLGTIFLKDGLLLKILCVLLADDKLQIPASECLLLIVSRRGKQEERFPMMTMFDDNAISTILNAATRACSADHESYFYMFLKKLCQILMELGKQLCHLWGAPGKKIKCPSNFGTYLEAVMSFSKHPSLTLNSYTLSLWLSFFKHDQAAKSEHFVKILPDLLTVCADKLKKVGFPSRNDHESCAYSRLDFDNDSEFTVFGADCRCSYSNIIRYLCKKYPMECFKLMDSLLTEQLTKPILTAIEGTPNPPEMCDQFSPSYVEWHAVASFMDYVIGGLMSLKTEEPNKHTLLEFMAKCFGPSSQDAMILSAQLSCLSACCAFIKYGSEPLPKIFEKVFEGIEYTLAGVDKENQPRTVKTLRKHSCSLFLKICRDHAAVVYNIFTDIDTKVKSLFAADKLSQFESIVLLEGLVLLSNQLLKYDKHIAYLKELIQPAQDAWFSAAIQHAVSSAPSFLTYIGLTKAPVKSLARDTAGKKRKQIGYCVNSIVGVARRCHLPEEIADAELGDYILQSDPVRYKNPSFELTGENIESIISLIQTLNNMWDPQVRQRVHAKFANIYELNDKEKLLILGLDSPTEVIVDKTDPINRTRGFIEDTFEMAYLFLGIMCKNVRYQFFAMPIGPVINEQIISTLTHVPDYRLKYIFRHFLKPYLNSCPSDQFESIAIPFLTALCPFMLQRLTTKWEEMQATLNKIEDEADNCEAVEALCEVLLRTVTKEYIDLLASNIVQASKSSSRRIDDSSTGDHHGVELTSLGEAVMNNQDCYAHVVLSIFNSLSWPDTTASVKSISMCVPIIKQMLSNDSVNEDLAVYIMRSVLHGLEVHGKHENIEPAFTTVASNLYQLLLPKFPNLADLLKQIPDVDLELIETYNQMVNLPKHERNTDKKRRDLFRKITSKIIQVHTGQKFRSEIEFQDLPPIFVKKEKMQAEEASAEDGLSELFGSADGDVKVNGVTESTDVAMEEA